MIGQGVFHNGNLMVSSGSLAYPIVLAFAITAVLLFLSWASLSLTREPAVYGTKPSVSQLDYLSSLPAVLRRDRNFLYLLSQIIFSLSGAARK